MNPIINNNYRIKATKDKIEISKNDDHVRRLSDRHIKILEFLFSYVNKAKQPSLQEIADFTGINSAVVVSYYLDQLEQAGYIEHNRKLSRRVKFIIKELPDEVTLAPSKRIEVKISPKVFISYAKEDLRFAREIHSFLKQNNLSPWLDENELLPGQNWELEIQKAIETSDYVIICLSNNSITKRGFIQKEIRKALSVLEEIPEGKIYIIPLRLEFCEVPSTLISKQWLDWYQDDAQKRLLRVFDFPNISSRFNKKNQGTKFKKPKDYILDALKKEKSMDEIIPNLIFEYDIKPSQAEKIYNNCYKESLSEIK